MYRSVVTKSEEPLHLEGKGEYKAKDEEPLKLKVGPCLKVAKKEGTEFI